MPQQTGERMTISELIRQLNKCYEAEGDLYVYLQDVDGKYYRPVSVILGAEIEIESC